MLHIPRLDKAQALRILSDLEAHGHWTSWGRLLVALDVIDTVTKALDTFETLEWHVTFPGEREEW
jgi:hypothetical protein